MSTFPTPSFNFGQLWIWWGKKKTQSQVFVFFLKVVWSILFYLLIYLLAIPHGLQNFSSPTRDRRKPCPLQWKRRVPTAGPPGNSQTQLFLFFLIYVFIFLAGNFYTFLKKKIYLFLFLAALGLRCCVRAFSSCGEQGLLFITVCGLLLAVSSPVAERGL